MPLEAGSLKPGPAILPFRTATSQTCQTGQTGRGVEPEEPYGTLSIGMSFSAGPAEIGAVLKVLNYSSKHSRYSTNRSGSVSPKGIRHFSVTQGPAPSGGQTNPDALSRTHSKWM